jgi:hypothetical protein
VQPAAGKPEEKPTAAQQKKKEETAEDDGLGTFEDLLEPSTSEK